MSVHSEEARKIGERVRNKELLIRSVIVLLVSSFMVNLFINTTTLFKVDKGVDAIVACVEEGGACSQQNNDTIEVNTNTIVASLAALVICTSDTNKQFLLTELKDCLDKQLSTLTKKDSKND